MMDSRYTLVPGSEQESKARRASSPLGRVCIKVVACTDGGLQGQTDDSRPDM